MREYKVAVEEVQIIRENVKKIESAIYINEIILAINGEQERQDKTKRPKEKDTHRQS